MSWSSPRRLAKALLALSLASSALADITLTFYDAAGSPIGAPASVPLTTCQQFDPTAYPDFVTVKASDPQAALNLYDTPYCSYTIRSAVGEWNSTQVANIIAVRHEGTSQSPTGTISEKEFPKGMAIQSVIPDPEEPHWGADPEKGKIVIIVVSIVLALGVFIGAYQVYEAAQYKPPPKKPKKPKTGLNTKKIKKKDAYFKKPMKEDEQSFQRLHNDSSPEPHSQMMERSRESQYSEGTYLDWTSRNNSQLNVSHANTGARKGDVSIDMRGPSPSPMGNRPYTPDLIHFDNNNNNNNNNSSNGYNTNYNNNNNNNNQRGRGGEVLVPMHNLDYSQQNGRSAVRRSSSSRSR
ncbi:hypothetical protein CPC16_002105 [Podila verticillata]|nr:hypothetical protein CPC16_002105 [Podila verticillata]